MSIKAVVFDYGNVISEPLDPLSVGLLASIAGADEASFTRELWGQRGEWDRGSLTGEAYYTGILSALGLTADEGTLAALIRSDLESWAVVNEKTVALMREMKASGLKVAILSNVPHEFLALARKRFPLMASVDVGVYSCELGVIKPEKAIYETLLSRLGCAPAETVFFDDLERNVAGAASCGIKAFLWKDVDSARSALCSLGAL